MVRNRHRKFPLGARRIVHLNEPTDEVHGGVKHPPAIVMAAPDSSGWIPVIRGTSQPPPDGNLTLSQPVLPTSALGKLMGLSKPTYFRADDFKAVREDAFVHRESRNSLSAAQFLNFRTLWDAAEMQAYYENFLKKARLGQVPGQMEKLVPHNSLKVEAPDGPDDDSG